MLKSVESMHYIELNHCYISAFSDTQQSCFMALFQYSLGEPI